MDRREEAIQAVIGGVNTEIIAQELGVSRSTIYLWLEEGDYLEQLKEIRNREVADAYRSDMPVADIFSDFEISQSTLYRILREEDVELRRSLVDEDEEAIIVLLYTEGYPIQKIEDTTGRSTWSIYNILHKHNVRLRRYSTHQGR